MNSSKISIYNDARFRVVDVSIPYRPGDGFPHPIYYDADRKIFLEGPGPDPKPKRTAFDSAYKANSAHLSKYERDWQEREDQVRRRVRVESAKNRALHGRYDYFTPEHTPEREMRETAEIAAWHERQSRPAPPPTLCERIYSFFFG